MEKDIDLENLPFLVYAANSHGELVYANQSFFMKVKHLKNKPVLLSDFMGKNDYKRIYNIHNSLFENKVVSPCIEVFKGEFKESVETLSVKYLLNYPSSGKESLILSFCIEMEENTKELLHDFLISENEHTFTQIINMLPAHIAWKDKNGRLMGCNDEMLKSFGVKHKEDLLGKDSSWINTPEQVAHIKKIDHKILTEGVTIVEEEPGTLASGEQAIFLSKKAPLKNKAGEIEGTLGVSLNITDRKILEAKATELKLENALQKKTLETQQAFNQVASQVAHDIRSPLSSLTMVIKSCADIPEAERIALREAAERISDIANSLLKRFRIDQLQTDVEVDVGEVIEVGEPLLVSTALMQLITDKKYEYPMVQWTLDIAPNAHFAFMAVDASAFKRSLSNIINNAVDACLDRAAQIIVRLEVEEDSVRMTVEDNGEGIPTDVLNKINRDIAVTAGKKSGHGIGLAQVRETLQTYHGSMTFNSVLSQGTQVTLQFPRIDAPDWMAEQIVLRPGDKVIVLDDDASIHGAWDSRFQSVLHVCPSIELHHFSQGQKALDFIQSHSVEQKQACFLLSDYELLKQDLDGLMVIENSQLPRTLLVTSHYRNLTVRERAAKIDCKILPKQMASEITIDLEQEAMEKEAAQSVLSTPADVEAIDVIVVDDDATFVKNLVMFVLSDLNVKTFNAPEALLQDLSAYRKDAKILLDNQFENSALSGMDLAKQLHEQGYTQLYLLSGQTFKAGETPDYVTVIRKDDIDRLTQLF